MTNSRNDSNDAVTDVVQIGLVVRDAEHTAKEYQRLLGVEEWFLNAVDTTKDKGKNFRYRERRIDTKAKIIWARLGQLEIELIEPKDEDSVYAEFLRDKGPGVHHIMFHSEDTNASEERLQTAGIAKLASGELKNTRFSLFDTSDALGLICEFAEGGVLEHDSAL